jgi:hypothetical protein
MIGGVAACMVILAAAARIGARDAAPAQPIEFSHKVHSGDYKIDCLYCHSYAPRSQFAGVPAMDRCMGCHQIVAADRPEIQKLREHWERGEVIAWNKVYVLPRFVRFSHQAHVRAEVGCQECHGAVESMDRVSKASSLEMGWCMDCHSERKASLDCLACHY